MNPIKHGRTRLLFAIAICGAWLTGCAAAPRLATQQNFVAAPPATKLGDLVPAQSLPARDEELWIVEKPDAGSSLAQLDNATGDAPQRTPGGGMLLSARDDMLTALPLEKTEVQASIDGIIASVDVKQRFSNSSKERADVLYAFPLPQNAAVNEFILSVGQRHIRAIIRERAEAEQIYREARTAGLLVSLIVQQTPNVFVQRVANLEAGAAVDVEIRYFHTLTCRDGWFEFEFPLISGLRGRGITRPAERDGRNIALSLHVSEEATIGEAQCPSHQMTITHSAQQAMDAVLDSADRIANRDLLFRYRVTPTEVKGSLAVERDGAAGGTFSLLLIPPEVAAGGRLPIEAIVAIDPATTNAGNAQAMAVLRCLLPGDTFELLGGVRPSAGFSEHPVPADARHTDDACAALGTGFWTSEPPAKSLTEQLPPHYDTDRRRIIFFITEGRGPEAAAQVDAATFVVIAASPTADREAVDALAKSRGGVAVHLTAGDPSGVALSQLIGSLSRPVLSDLQLNWGSAAVEEIFPKPSTELFAGHPISLVGKFHGSMPTSITLHGKVGVDSRTWTIASHGGIDLPGQRPIASVWARRKIADLARSALSQADPALDHQVRDLALEYGLLSRYTSFIMVDAQSSSQQSATARP